jgi:predicted ester cyclase
MDIHRIANGRIAEEWAQSDLLTLLKQLGGGC